MTEKLSQNYDAIIIGAGIGGLVCGCFLAKAGKKVLIVEKTATAGGCCTSFTTKGFTFDAFAHSLGGLRPDGVLDVVLRELDLKNRISIHRHDPSDIFVTPDHRISFWNDLNRTIDDLKSAFPHESPNIDRLMSYLAYNKGGDAVRLRNLTFLDFLGEFIKDEKLRCLISLSVLGNAGLPPSMMSAFTATKLYQEFHLDGGYFSEGGMQQFSNLFANRLKELGGEILLSKMVAKLLLTSDGRASGVELKGGEKILSSLVVSNCDSNQTFNDFINDARVKKPNIQNMKPSSSIYSIFVGTDEGVVNQNKDLDATLWHMFDYDIEDMYLKACEGNFEKIPWFMIFSSPDKKGFGISILAPFKDEEFWSKNRDLLFDRLLSRAKERLPMLKNLTVKHRAIITPQVINKWTSNYQGAAYGWASTPAQTVVSGLTQTSFIEGLFLTGHWTTQTIGVSGVAYMGRDTAKIVLNRLKK